jgi:HAMP domain-containing protein
MGLKAKFNLAMLAAFIIGLGLAAAFSYRVAKDEARRQVMQEALVMLGQASAISTYTDQEISPLLADQLKVRFLPQSIPFAAARANFHLLEKSFPDYSFKEAALNPTNPADRATDWEADIIGAFDRNPKLAQITNERDTPTGRVLAVARPVRVSDKSCLECHSTASAAPPTLVDLYGPSNGFGWKLGQTIGATIVSVPMSVALARAARSFEIVIAGLAAVFLVMILLLNVLLHYVIIRPVRRMSAIAGEVSLGNMDAPEFPTRGRDEIASLAESFNRMRRSLANALRLLGG